MYFAELLFWILLGILFYTYLGYGILIAILALLKKVFSEKDEVYNTNDFDQLPSLTLLVAAYNEEQFIEEKIKNSLDLNYPKEKISYVFVSDGSNDLTPEIIEKHSSIKHYYQTERQGKIAAVQRVTPFVESEIIVFTDANTTLNQNALLNLVRHFKASNVGAVAGEKRILDEFESSASGAGEGIYWQYESLLKKWDSDFHTVVGAAGELFAIRSKLYETVESDTLVEDFVMTMDIAAKGYKVVYEPDAYAIEGPSDNITEELKRKKRISAGGWQAMFRLKKLLNPFKYGRLSFQYISHRVLRLTIAPFSLPLIFIINLYLYSHSSLYTIIFLIQVLFYSSAGIGWLLMQRNFKLKFLFVPFYFCFMNYSVFAGLISLLKGEQTVVWEKAKRTK